jgi:hypothetical protein
MHRSAYTQSINHLVRLSKICRQPGQTMLDGHAANFPTEPSNKREGPTEHLKHKNSCLVG